MWSFARFGTICTIWKMWKTPTEECYFIACNLKKVRVTLHVLFTFSKLCKWYQIAERTLHKKWSFPLRISSVNVTKFGFGHIYWRNPWWKTSFLWSGITYSFHIREIIELRTPILRSKLFFISYTQNFPVKKQKLSIQKSPALIKIDY